MSVKNQLTVQVDHLLEDQQMKFSPSSAGKCEINVQVAEGWAITGHYQDNTLRTVTLQKTSETEDA
jgi:hypothetical protein